MPTFGPNGSLSNPDDIRIKIRKNSIEPAGMVKASHKPMYSNKKSEYQAAIMKNENVIFEEAQGDIIKDKMISEVSSTPTSRL